MFDTVGYLEFAYLRKWQSIFNIKDKEMDWAEGFTILSERSSNEWKPSWKPVIMKSRDRIQLGRFSGFLKKNEVCLLSKNMQEYSFGDVQLFMMYNCTYYTLYNIHAIILPEAR